MSLCIYGTATSWWLHSCRRNFKQNRSQQTGKASILWRHRETNSNLKRKVEDCELDGHMFKMKIVSVSRKGHQMVAALALIGRT